ncbi:MAG: SDR family oxidoreductase [Planctomycetes bacterium]|nr:SDR family oxidoreductase [Planctomycetota bacterium]
MSESELPLLGHVAVVTGSSSGIGRAMAVRLARAGADIVVHACANRDQAQATAAEIQRLGRDSRMLLADLGDSAQLEEFFRQCWSWRNGCDIWINNAGVDLLTTPARSLPFDQKLELLWRVDVQATIRLSRLAGQQMTAREIPGAPLRDTVAGSPRDTTASSPAPGLPVILNMSWDQVDWGMAGESGELFCAAKGAIAAFSRSLARSLAPRVRVNCLAPGWIRTKWGETAPEYWRDRACQESLLERWGTAEEVAEAALFLACPAASFITGQTLAVNGGFRISGSRPDKDTD